MMKRWTRIGAALGAMFVFACGGSQDAADTTTPAAAATEPADFGDNATPAVAPAEGRRLVGADGQVIGAPAPDFTLKDLDGKDVSLADFKGKTVVLEWFNPGCPFIQYAHGEGPLKALSSPLTGDGQVVWLAINSGKAGKQGAGLEINQAAASKWNIQHPVLLDETGSVGQAYGAKTTPHMFVISSGGAILYRGALDNAPLGKAEGEYVNYVAKALEDIGLGKPVANAETKPYGCGVKY